MSSSRLRDALASPLNRARLSALIIVVGVVGITVCGGKVFNNSADFPYYQHSQEQLISVILLSSSFFASYSCCVYIWRQRGVLYHVVLKIDAATCAPPPLLANAALVASSLALFLILLFFVFIWRSPLQVGVFAACVLCSVYLLISLFLFATSHGPLRPTRLSLRSSLSRVLSSPLLPVQFMDNLIADSYTSFPSLAQRFALSVCGLMSGEWWDYDSTLGASLLACNNNTDQYRAIFGVFQVLPYWIRLLQCCRRFYDAGSDRTWAKKFSHSANAGKYLVDIIYILLSIARTQSKGVFLYRAFDNQSTTAIWWFFLVLKTLYSFAWDLLMDWGLGDSKNGFLRPTLCFPKKWYYAAVVQDFFLRILWTFSLAPQNFQQAFEYEISLASLEIFRRSVWILFRVEWECVNNSAISVSSMSSGIADSVPCGINGNITVLANPQAPPCREASSDLTSADVTLSLL